MGKKNFEKLLQRHKTESAEKKDFWEKQKNEWLAFIKIFHYHIESWFAPYQDEDKLYYKYRDIKITEEHIGTYTSKIMEVDFAGQKLTLEPLGTLLIGTKGRIDMEGPRGRIQFILADKDSKGMNVVVSTQKDSQSANQLKEPNWTWKIVLRESNKISYAEFTEENFFDALMEVVNG